MRNPNDIRKAVEPREDLRQQRVSAADVNGAGKLEEAARGRDEARGVEAQEPPRKAELMTALASARTKLTKLRRERGRLVKVVERSEMSLRGATERVRHLEGQIASEMRRADALTGTVRTQSDQLDAMVAEVAAQRAHVDGLTQELMKRDDEAAEWRDENAQLRRDVEAAREETASLRDESVHLRMQLSAALGYWSEVRPSYFRTAAQFLSWIRRGKVGFIRAYWVGRRAQRVDPAAYYVANPDVAVARLDPLMHYIEHGVDEQRAQALVRPHVPARVETVPLAGEALATDLPHVAEFATRPLDVTLPAMGWERNVVVEKLGGVLAEFGGLLSEFDGEHYRTCYDVAGTDPDLLIDYLTTGWRLGRDPNGWFSTTYYLAMNADIREAGINPFVHYILYGRSEARLPQPYRELKRRTVSHPTVSAIVPCFNHARFLQARLDSILAQRKLPDEIILLDDASTDGSQELLRAAADLVPVPCRVYINKQNSGNVFRQWRKGLSHATGDLIWICESDDFADEGFLEALVPYFTDPAVMVGFGKIEFADVDGRLNDWLDHYRGEAAPPEFWKTQRVESAYEWFRGPFGLLNAIPNVGGCVFRRQTLESRVWREAQRYSTCGDWYLYIQLARAGRIAYDCEAVSYFRQHGGNTSVANFSELDYYEEHSRIARELRRVYGVDDSMIERFHGRVKEHFFRHFGPADAPLLDEVFDLPSILSTPRETRHVSLGILGFTTGGAELFAINLANALVDRGYHVSLLVLNPDEENKAIRALVRPEVAIYERPLVEEIGLPHFLEAFGIDIIHTHFLGVDLWLHDACRDALISYVVTLHGSYEAGGVTPEVLRRLASRVDQWVYTADKNLVPFATIGEPVQPFTKLTNAVPVNSEAAPFERDDFGIPGEAFVFGLASRALHEKGWGVAADAIARIREATGRDVHLALCGDGPDYDDLFASYGDRPEVHFLGYRSGIIDFYRMCDCCVLPTRFEGESFPFTLIESLQAGTPIVATRIGEIPSIVEGGSAGILVDATDDDEGFVARVAAAMLRMLGSEREGFVRGASRAADAYSFERVVSEYAELYESVIAFRARR
jgi:glycosyltransferase involved in cell wall biosynthesis